MVAKLRISPLWRRGKGGRAQIEVETFTELAEQEKPNPKEEMADSMKLVPLEGKIEGL